jgi:putative spermidine/putrescine transport system ATP-binding protein
MKTIMELDGLQFQYPRKGSSSISLDSLCLREGGTLALHGSSGAGKTTILRLIAGLLTPSGGSIKLDGEDVTTTPSSGRRIGMVFQQPMLFPYLDVQGNVAFPIRMRGASKTSSRGLAGDYLAMVGMSNFAKRPVQTLSGGQAQRVALARALAANPRLLLLDEPFAALDVDVRAEMQELVVQLRSEIGLSMILVTHDQREAAVLADDVALIDNGTILQQGKVSELYRKPISLKVFRAMGGVNELPGRIEGRLFHSKIGVVRVPKNELIQGPATLIFRQEAASVSVNAGAHVNEFQGQVTSIRSIGYRQEIDIEVSGQKLTVETNYLAHVGEVLNVGLSPDECHIIPCEGKDCPESLSILSISTHRSNTKIPYEVI